MIAERREVGGIFRTSKMVANRGRLAEARLPISEVDLCNREAAWFFLLSARRDKHHEKQRRFFDHE